MTTTGARRSAAPPIVAVVTLELARAHHSRTDSSSRNASIDPRIFPGTRNFNQLRADFLEGLTNEVPGELRDFMKRHGLPVR